MQAGIVICGIGWTY